MTRPNQPGRLFDALRGDLRASLAQRTDEARGDVLVFAQGQTNDLARAVSAGLRVGAYYTSVVYGDKKWNPRSQYYEAFRQAARSDKRVEHAFLLPLRSSRKNAILREHIRLDAEAGIVVSVLYVGRLISDGALPHADHLEFGIWDFDVACFSKTIGHDAGGGAIEWRVSKRQQDVKYYSDLWSILSAKAERVDLDVSDASAVDLEEPMLVTAPIAAELAAVLCKGDHVNRQDCTWYHSVWQYLRIFDMVSTPAWHAKFYFNTLTAIVSERPENRILISGTADYSMLAHVTQALQHAGREAHIVVIDLCETPLLLCRWYGKFTDTPVVAVATNILVFTDVPFDLIVTDAFLTRLSEHEQAEVLARWFELLRPGGRVVTTVRVTPGSKGVITHSTREQIDAYRHRAFVEAQKWCSFLRHTPDEIADMAYAYASQMASLGVGSAEDVTQAFEKAGFAVETQTAEVRGEMTPTTYARVIATKPAVIGLAASPASGAAFAQPAAPAGPQRSAPEIARYLDVLRPLSKISLRESIVVGEYRRHKDEVRLDLRQRIARMGSALFNKTNENENVLIWAAPGSGKTFLIEEFARSLEGRIGYYTVNFANDSRTKMLQARDAIQQETKPRLVLFDEIDAGCDDSVYDDVFSLLDENKNTSVSAVIAAVGSTGDSLDAMVAQFQSRNKLRDLLDRIPVDHRFKIPPAEIEDKITLMLGHAKAAAGERNPELRYVEKLAVFYALCNLETPRQLGRLFRKAVERMDAHEEVLTYDCLFEHRDPGKFDFRDQHRNAVRDLARDVVTIDP